MEPFRIDIDPDDYKSIWKYLKMTPQQWNKLQAEIESRRLDKLYQEYQIKIASCTCRSPWCQHCATRSPSLHAISERILALRADCIRHVVLTVARTEEPSKVFARIRKDRAIARTIRRLDLQESKWLWVLEFHRGGFPHWHLLIETSRGRGGMIGKRRIQKAWRFGVVWESFVRDEEHKRRMAGYARKTGYLAGENKGHQIELPDYLLGQSRVRKYGSNFNPAPPPPRPEADRKPTGKPRKRAKPYSIRFDECNKTCRVFTGRGGIIEIGIPGSLAREIAGETLDKIDHSTFNGDTESALLAIERMTCASADGLAKE
jgi:hypothetical protein